MPGFIKNDVCVIILCYGDRLSYLKRVLDSVCSNNPGKIVLIANAVSADVMREIQGRTSINHSMYYPVISETNLGSAGGYALGIGEAISRFKYKYYWLLDDDNCPEDDALDALISCCNNAPIDRDFAVASRRVTPGNLDPLGGWAGETPRNGTCVGFHILNFLYKPQIRKRHLSDFVLLSWSVYGGLLIPYELIRNIGLPKKEFFLYGDDLEWTYRIIRNGKMILTCPESRINDLSPSWNYSGGGSNLRRRICDADPFRVYYEVRNRTWINRKHFPGNTFTYMINKSIFLMSTLLISLRYGKLERFWLIRKAIKDGENGRLGSNFESY